MKLSDLKLEQGSVVKFMAKDGISSKNIHERIEVVYEKSNPLYFHVKYCCKVFKWSRDSIYDVPKFERSPETQIEETINKIKIFVVTDR